MNVGFVDPIQVLYLARAITLQMGNGNDEE
jgi:hypothetical protein